MKRKDIFFYILIPSWNVFEYSDRCIDSVLLQSYKKFTILFADDCSEYTIEQKKYIRSKLKNHIVCFNNARKYAVRNVYETIHAYVQKEDAVIVNVDGDDWLPDKDVLSFLSHVYKQNDCLLTYGDCFFWDGDHISTKAASKLREYTNIPYPISTVKSNSYRKELFYPLHIRSWKAWLYKKIRSEDFKNGNGEWLKYCVDLAMYLPMFEMANGRYSALTKPLYVYNTYSPHNIIKVNPIDAVKEELIIRRKEPYRSLF